MLRDVTIEPMALHRPLLPAVANWFRTAWPAWYGPGGPGDADRDLDAFATLEARLPRGLVALHHGCAVGCGALRAESIASHRHLSPWASAGYVLPALRGQGVGSALLRALVGEALRLGYGRVFCATSTAATLLIRSGWRVREVAPHEGAELVIFEIATRDAANGRPD